MKKLSYLIVAFLAIQTSVFAQEKKKEKYPDERIIINKKFDDKGNLTEYDSTYVHQWFSDTTMNFDFPNNLFAGKGFNGLENFMKDFFNDSLPGKMPGIGNFEFPFNENDFFGNDLNNFFNDSTFLRNNPFFNDSIFNSGPRFLFEPGNRNKKGYIIPKPDENSVLQHFEDPDQEKEWLELMERHQKELLDFQRKWNGKKKGKVY